MKIAPFAASLLMMALLAGCQDKNKPAETAPAPQTSAAQETGIFTATGHELDWQLSLDPAASFRFQPMNGDPFNTPAVAPQINGTIRHYVAQVEMGTLDVTLEQTPCKDTMADQQSPYTVTVTLTFSRDQRTQSYQGCGSFSQ